MLQLILRSREEETEIPKEEECFGFIILKTTKILRKAIEVDIQYEANVLKILSVLIYFYKFEKVRE